MTEKNKLELINIYDKIPGVVYQFRLSSDGKLSFPFITKNVRELFGISDKEIIKNAEIFLKQIHPDDIDSFQKAVQKSAENLEDYNHEHRHILDSGEIVWLSAKSTPDRIEDGSIIWTGIAIDITDQRKAEEKVASQEHQIRTIFNAAPVSMMILDENTKVIAANNIIMKIFHISESDVINTQPGDGLKCIIRYNNPEGCGFSEECKRCKMRLNVTKVLNSGKAVKNEEIESTFVINGKPVDIWIEMSAEPITLNDKKHVIVAFNDITRRKKAELQLSQSEKKFRTVAEYTNDWEYWIDENRNYLYMSKSVKEHTGYSIDDFIQKRINMQQIATEEYKELISKHMMSDMKSLGNICSFDFKIKTADGSTKWMNHVCKAVYDEDGQFLGRRGSNRDITKMKLAQDALLDGEKKFREKLEKEVKLRTKELDSQYKFLKTLIDTIPLPVFVKDSDGKYTTVNKAFVDYYENSYDEIIGNTVEIIAPKDVVKLTNDIDNNLLKNADHITYDSFHILKSGEKRDIAIYKSTFGYEKEKPEGVAGIVIDITEQKKLEERNQKALRHAQELNDMKTNFISMVSHEFRTPLTSILTSADLLEMYGQNWSEEKFKKNVSILQESVKEMVDLLNDVLTLSRTDRGKISFNPDEIDLEKVVTQIVDEANRLSGNSHNILTNFKTQIGNIIGDEKLISGILNYLLDNAIKYSPKGSSINLTLDKDDKNITIIVQDEGYGITKKELKYLFDPFYKTKRAAETKGSGLGLAIVKKFIELHKGSISVDSDVDKGTTFVVKLTCL